MFEAELYPPEWKRLRREKLERAGYRCEECHVEHLALRANTKTGQPYIVYLSIAHKRQYETWKCDADTMVLCQRCHRRYDRRFRRKAGHKRTFIPVGYARVLVEDERHAGNLCTVGDARTQDELRALIAALPDGVSFAVQLIMNEAIVGNGAYQRAGNGVTVLHEYGACQGLPLSHL